MARSVVLSLMLALSACGPQSNLRHIKTNYQAARVELRKHLVDDFWIDNDPRSPELLARQWSLAGQWVAAWLSNRPSVSPDDVKTAILELAPGTNADSLACIALNDTTFLVTGPGPIGNVFIVTRSGRGYRLAWSTAQHQESIGKQDGVIAAWRPENARQGNRGPDRGAVIPRLGRLPADANGHPRFYIDGIYAQSAGGTVGAQISIWLWDGVTARPLIARNFTYMIDQAVGTRMEGDLLKVQQKEFFQTFFACGGCEERQTDWILRIAADGIEDLGDTPVVPELDTIDELFYRLIHGKSVAGMAAPEALVFARRMLATSHGFVTEEQWRQLPTLGMMMEWTVQKDQNDVVLCLATDRTVDGLFRLRQVGGKSFIADISEASQGCPGSKAN